SVADVILPVPIWAEKEGTYLNIDGKIQWQSKILEPLENVKENRWIMTEVSKLLGREIKCPDSMGIVSKLERIKREGFF
ncbi:MAG: molybdopterin-dependent oxidoreductase, partial [Candidatus Hadarchaeum sp.]